MEQPQLEEAAYWASSNNWRPPESIEHVFGSPPPQPTRATTMVSWHEAAEQLGIELSRLRDGVTTGEFPAAAPWTDNAFTVRNVLDIDAIERLRRASEDSAATASEFPTSLGE